MDPSGLQTPESITRDERTNAMLAHVLTIFAGFIAAGIIWLVKQRESKFIAFHALQAFLWHLLFFAVMTAGVLAVIVTMFATAGFSAEPAAPAAHGGPPPLGFFLGFFGFWIVMMLGWVANVGSCIYLAIRANEGKWTRYPLVGSLAMRLAGLRG
jgi:uncharacterized Tic20 family protein